MDNTKQQVREFYDEIGWSQSEDGLYQNTRYEDLRPVSQEYIHGCRLRVKRHLASSGDYLLDAGSGPVQYPEYLTYSENYRFRVCADISITALKEARNRLGDKGLYVVADIANLPFKSDAFDGMVSMHAIHHIPSQEHRQAYLEMHRTLKEGKTGVIVNGWTHPLLVGWLNILVKWFNRAWRFLRGKPLRVYPKGEQGTFIRKINARWLRRELKGDVPFEVYAWRTLGTALLRTFVHPQLGGKAFLRFLFKLEDRFPRFFGENGQYPLIVIKK